MRRSFIPQANPGAGCAAVRLEIDAAVARVLDSGSYILGSEVRSFETEFAQYLEASHAVGVASGTDALELALRACGVGPGDEVITVSHTAAATVAAIVRTGAHPVFADVDSRRFTLEPRQLGELASSRTKALVPVHLYGLPAEVDSILEFARSLGLVVVEDCAQAHGALYRGRRAGTFGNAAAFSFYPTKNLGALGDGGCVVTSSAQVANRVRQLREYGWRERHVSHGFGVNSRLDEIQAAVLRVKLRALEEDNQRRRRLASRYDALLGDITGLVLPPFPSDSCPVYHQYVIRTRRRDRLADALARQGIETAVHYPIPVHLQPAYRGRFRAASSMAHTEELCHEIMSLPMYPQLDPAQLERVALGIRSCL